MSHDLKSINETICTLLDYAEKMQLIGKYDRIYSANAICADLNITEFYDRGTNELPNGSTELLLEGLLDRLCDYAAEKEIIADTRSSRDNFDTKLMGHLSARPSEIIARFEYELKQSPKLATDSFYAFCRNSNYIRAARVARDLRWTTPSEYGDIEISINMSKPEKDPRDIAAALSAPKSSYPACLLCHENVGYPGNVTAPARQNLRQIPVNIGGENWFLQYSPYVYYNEHCIVLSPRHEPMKITHSTFVRLLDFVTLLPHYFVGSNADLPIVGGSILTHDHMQGGCYEFPMAKADIEIPLEFKEYPEISAGIVRWPMPVIRLRSAKKDSLIAIADRILALWREYSDPDAFVFAYTDGTPHNTVTPIARRRGDDFELDLVLRNNITTAELPMGVFHPHPDKHNIKKENIGLIEVMGLAVLPSRLTAESERLAQLIISGADIASDEVCGKHASWFERFGSNYKFTAENALDIVHDEIGKTFVEVLRDAGTFKDTPEGRKAFLRFTSTI